MDLEYLIFILIFFIHASYCYTRPQNIQQRKQELARLRDKGKNGVNITMILKSFCLCYCCLLKDENITINDFF